MIEKWAPTATRCPLDGQITTLDSTIYASPITTTYYNGAMRLTEPARAIGTILGCGHILAADWWQHRIAVGASSVPMGWWVGRTDPESNDYTIPPEAVPLKIPTEPTP